MNFPAPNYVERDLETLERQLKANRGSARYRNGETGHRHFCHENTFRQHFVRDIIGLRAAIKERKHG